MKTKNLLIASLLFTGPCLGMQKKHTPEEQLILATQQGDLSFVKDLIAEGVNVHINDEQPLKIAAQNGDVCMVETLMEAGANASTDNYGELIKAHLLGHPILLATLAGMPRHEGSFIIPRKAQSKLDVFAKTFDPSETYLERALLCACIDNNLISAQELIAKKANIRARDNLALKIAFQNNYPEMVTLLLKNGASLDGQTPEEFAKRYAPRIKQGPFMSPLKKDPSDVDLEKKEALLQVMHEGLEASKA